MRLTRAESQQETRRALVGAAREQFSEVGYSAASLDRIADDAGFTRGAIYANFDGKAGLFFAVLDERLDQQLDELSDVSVDLARIGSWRRDNARAQEGLSLAVQEFRVIAMRDEALLARLRLRDRRVRHGFASLIERALDGLAINLPMEPNEVAALLLALGEGITQQHQLDPDEVPMDLFERAVAMFLSVGS